MFFAVFRKFVVLFFCYQGAVFGQSVDNVAFIELGQTNFPIERPFTISVVIPNSESRPTINFPDVPTFTKKGISASVTTSEVGGKTVTNQVITQSYQASVPGRFRLPPFTITVNGEALRSEGANLVVRPSATAPASATLAASAPPPNGAAFLSLRASKSAIYAGEGVALTLSFFVADNYPYVLNFTALDRQMQDITKRIRPANTWEENSNITELKPVPVLVGGKKFREFRLYHAVFFPLTARPLPVPAVSLRLARPRPKIGPPSAQPETVVFSSKPLIITVRPLPAHPLRGRVPVGVFRLEESLDRPRVGAGQSIRYSFAVAGEGNMATLPTPATLIAAADVDIFPPEERHTLSLSDNRITGRKQFTYFIVPHQSGPVSLTNRFQWVYFNLQTARYDTLRSRLQLTVSGVGSTVAPNTIAPVGTTVNDGSAAPANAADNSIYAGIERLDSTDQPINGTALMRAVANVLIVLMLLGMIFVFFRK